ncbi:MAG: tRNA (adenosine(37)-N6)-threonylcarbamoyltransferase complex dimerization subunit type 1 TsaB [Pseudomonadota bacterium]
MKLLAIETATEACSVALHVDGEVREIFRMAPREHARRVLGMADELLADAGLKPVQLDALAFGRGPGAFTGVRIASGVVQGIAFAAELPVVPVSTLAALAQGGYRQYRFTQVAAALDARMDEIYWGAFIEEDGLMRASGGEQVCPAVESPLLAGRGWHGVGSGWTAYAEALARRHGAAVVSYLGELFPHALDVAQLAVAAAERGEAVSAEQALPVYLRDRVVQRPAAG